MKPPRQKEIAKTKKRLRFTMRHCLNSSWQIGLKREADPGIGSTAFGFAKFMTNKATPKNAGRRFRSQWKTTHGEFANRAKQMTDRFSTIRDVPAFKAFREAVRRQDAIGRKMVEFVNAAAA